MRLDFRWKRRSGQGKTLPVAILAILSLIAGSTLVAQDKTTSSSISKKEGYRGRLNGGPLKINWDFGYVPIDYTMIYTVPLENVGQDSLRIVSVKSSCECTHPKVSAEFLPPGVSTPLMCF